MPPVESIQRTLSGLRAAQRALAARPVDDILDKLRQVVDAWRAPDSRWRAEAERRLPEASGFSSEMIRRGLPSMIDPLAGDRVAELLDRELGERQVLDRFVSGGRARGVGLVTHILAGNLPGQSLTAIVLGLAVKSALLVKAAAGDRVMPELFVDSLREIDPQLGGCAAATYWPGGARDVERAVFDASDRIVVSGADETIADIRGRCGRPVIGHGHRISIAVVDVASREGPGSAAGLALDVALWDQRGCLSPQVAYVEGGFAESCEFAERVGRNLDRLAVELPPSGRTVDEHAALQSFRQDVEWRRIAERPVALFMAEENGSWTIAVDDAPELRPTPLNRTLRIVPVNRLDDLVWILEPHAARIECAGLAVSAGNEIQTSPITDLLASLAIPRLCPVGQMQRPTLAWVPGGRPRLADLVTWSTLS